MPAAPKALKLIQLLPDIETLTPELLAQLRQPLPDRAGAPLAVESVTNHSMALPGRNIAMRLWEKPPGSAVYSWW